MNKDYLTDEYKAHLRQQQLDRSYKKHPYGYRIERKLKGCKKSALERGFEWAIDDESARECFVSKCFYCGRASEWDLRRLPKGTKIRPNGIDRLQNERGYVAGNIIPCCYRCNVSKNNLHVNEFFAMKRYTNFMNSNSNDSRRCPHPERDSDASPPSYAHQLSGREALLRAAGRSHGHRQHGSSSSRPRTGDRSSTTSISRPTSSWH